MSKVTIKNVSKVYSDNVTANCNLNFEVYDNELVALVGPSGSGKSTLLRLLAGIRTGKGKFYALCVLIIGVDASMDALRNSSICTGSVKGIKVVTVHCK